MNTVPFADERERDSLADGGGAILGDVDRVVEIGDAPVAGEQGNRAEQHQASKSYSSQHVIKNLSIVVVKREGPACAGP